MKKLSLFAQALFLALLLGSCETEEEETTVKDVDGNVYGTVKIGEQIWMTENLGATKFSDGTEIDLVEESTEWSALSEPGYCFYNNSPDYGTEDYGILYNWYTVDRGGLCPDGWHVASDADWSELISYIDPEAGLSQIDETLYLESEVAGGLLKEEGTSHWKTPNTGATNEFGFNALPAGYRYENGTFYLGGAYGSWWSSDQSNENLGIVRFIDYNTTKEFRSFDSKKDGFAVRCVKD